ncbi:MAG TPA: hypothetical protein VFV63_09665 [Ilumatobacteraceae bacterium]|nr:hypothetical protein [Ilumatobacteraceae bacterium]
MHPYIAAAIGPKRSGLAEFDGGFVAAARANVDGAVDGRSGPQRADRGVAGCLATFVLGSVAQGAPFVLVAAELERRDVGSGWLAAVAAVRMAPYLLCSPFAGALAGRYATRTVFAATGISRGALITALWIGLGMGAPALVLVSLLFLLIAVGTPNFPALMRAVHHTAPHARLDRTSALAAGLESAAFGAGPAFGGVLLLTDTTNSLLVCVAMMLVSAWIATYVPNAERTTRRIDGRSSRLVRDAGWCLVGPGIRTAIVAVLGVNVLAGINAALLVRLPDGLDLGGARAFGLLSFVSGAGAFAAFVALLAPIPRGRRPLIPLITAGAAIGVLAATSELPVALIACCVLGASILTAEVLVISTLGRALPGPLVAPAFGVLDALMIGAMVTGAAVAPVLTATVGLRSTLAIAAIGIPLLASSVLLSRPDRAGR